MKRPRTLLVVAAFVGLVGVMVVRSYAAPPRGAAGKPEPYVVVQTGDDVQVMTRSEFLAAKKSAADKYKQDMKDYKEAVKAAKKSKEKFDGPKPVKVEPKQVGATYKSKDEADKACEKRKQEKEEGKGDAKPAHS